MTENSEFTAQIEALRQGLVSGYDAVHDRLSHLQNNIGSEHAHLVAHIEAVKNHISGNDRDIAARLSILSERFKVRPPPLEERFTRPVQNANGVFDTLYVGEAA